MTFVEAILPQWDTHDDNFARSRALCGQLDQPYAFLLKDLEQRGLLERTLVIWMGEFGRSPRINPRAGRDHFPRGFSAVLAGGGVRGGQVLGATDAAGETVTDRPVTEKDLFQTIYKVLRIDARKENMSPIGRPIRFVDGGEPVQRVASDAANAAPIARGLAVQVTMPKWRFDHRTWLNLIAQHAPRPADDRPQVRGHEGGWS